MTDVLIKQKVIGPGMKKMTWGDIERLYLL